MYCNVDIIAVSNVIKLQFKYQTQKYLKKATLHKFLSSILQDGGNDAFQIRLFQR